jgi:hypothetical protein
MIEKFGGFIFVKDFSIRKNHLFFIHNGGLKSVQIYKTIRNLYSC